MNIIKYIAEQFGNPQGLGGSLSTFVMNRMNQRQYGSIVENLDSPAGGRVLDIGFGNGYLLRSLAERNAGSFYGIEVSGDMLAVAEKRNSRLIEGGKVQLKEGSAEAIPFPDEFFDRVYTVNTVYFWTDLSGGLGEIRRVLKPGGVFLNVIYTKEWLDKLRYTQYGFQKYTPSQLEEAALACGFPLVRTVEIKKDASYCVMAEKQG